MRKHVIASLGGTPEEHQQSSSGSSSGWGRTKAGTTAAGQGGNSDCSCRGRVWAKPPTDPTASHVFKSWGAPKGLAGCDSTRVDTQIAHTREKPTARSRRP